LRATQSDKARVQNSKESLSDTLTSFDNVPEIQTRV
jgi:hypothetical protein